MTTPRILITGFGPFPGVRSNPTARLMRSVAKRRQPGATLAGAELTVSYAGARRHFAELVAAEAPDAVLLLGLAASARWVRVERFARRSDSPLHPDATGRAGAGPAAGSGLPLPSTAAIEPTLAAFAARGVRVRPSASAGRYLCNAVYAQALQLAAGRPTIFIHLPYPRGHHGPTRRASVKPWRPVEHALEAALAQIARDLGVAARRLKLGQLRLA